MGWQVSSMPWRLRIHGGARTTAHPLRGSSSPPRGTPRATIRRRIESRSRPVAAPSLRKRPSSDIIFALIRCRVHDEKTPLQRSARRTRGRVKSTPLWTRVCKPPSRAQRMFTSSTGVYSGGPHVVHGERAQCELHDNGPVVPIGNHRQDVPSVRFGGRRRCPSPGCRPPAG